MKMATSAGGKKKFLISVGKELCGITEEAQPVAPVFATRKRKVYSCWKWCFIE